MYQTILQIELCMDFHPITYKQVVFPVAGNIFKILLARRTRSQNTENFQLQSDASVI